MLLFVIASPRLETLAKPTMRESQAIRANPFSVSKGALSATASSRTDSLAKPPRPRSPVERKPPREKDKYGAPIFIMPVSQFPLNRPSYILTIM